MNPLHDMALHRLHRHHHHHHHLLLLFSLLVSSFVFPIFSSTSSSSSSSTSSTSSSSESQETVGQDVVWIDTAIGKHLARRHQVHGREVLAFYGVRYAERPTERGRFKARDGGPGPHRHDLFYTPACPQRTMEDAPLEKMKVTGPVQEDCLYMNVWMPVQREGSLYPVVVIVHGGEFQWGSSSVEALNGVHLAARLGAVVVSFQYRLGALGFLRAGDGGFAPGNAGLADQVLALEWIRENVRHFSGDESRIVVIGHGAGASSLGYHLLSKKTSRLFQRAILLSGTPNSETAFVLPSEAKTRAWDLISKLSRDANSRDEDVLEKASWGDIVVAQHEVASCQEGEECLEHLNAPFVPTIDGRLITDHPLKMLRDAEHLRGKEIVIGWTKDEGTILANRHKNLETATTADDVSDAWLHDRLGMIARGDANLTTALIRLYGSGGGKTNLERFVDAVGDFYFKCPAVRFADELEERGASVIRLQFNYRPSTCPQKLKVAQGCDLDILFLHAHERGTDSAVKNNYFKFLSEFVHSGLKNIKAARKKNEVHVISLPAGQAAEDRSAYCRDFQELIPLYAGGSGSLVTIPSVALVVTFHLYTALLLGF